MSSIPEHIIIRSLQGISSAEEEQLLNEWLVEDEKHIHIFCQLQEIWDARNPVTTDTIHTIWYNIHNQVKKSGVKSTTTVAHPSRIIPWMRYAVAVLTGIVIASAAWLGIWLSQNSLQKELLVHNTVFNQNGVQQFILPDSSVIWIHGHSRINYASQFIQKERLVQLEGEAYFDVRKDTSTPFIVQTENVDIQVTGTEFYVNSRPDDHAVITLVSGGVSIDIKNKEGEIMTSTNLTPGQQADIDKLSGQLEVIDVDTSYYIAWKNGTYRFNNETLEKITELLAKRYGLTIHINPRLKDKRFTGRVKPEHSIKDVMDIIYTSYPIKYHQEGNTIYITE